MSDLVIGIAAGVAATLLLMVLAWVVKQLRPVSKALLQFRQVLQAARNGIVLISLHRTKLDAIATILSTEKEFVYIGLIPDAGVLESWCNQGFRKLLETGRKVVLIFWDAAVDKSVKRGISAYYAVTPDELDTKIEASWQVVRGFAASLTQACRVNLEARSHHEILTDSVFMIDTAPDHRTGRLQLDQKLYGLGKAHSTVLCLEPTKDPNSHFRRACNSFNLIRLTSSEVNLD